MKVLYARYSRNRLSDFQIETVVFDYKGRKRVLKRALSPEASNHIKNTYKNYFEIQKNTKSNNIKLPEIFDYSSDFISFEFIEGKTFDSFLLTSFQRKDKDGFLDLIDRYYDFLVNSFALKDDLFITGNASEIFEGMDLSLLKKQSKFYSLSSIDLIFDNIILRDNIFYLLDQEWVLDGALPVSFVFFRGLLVFYRKFGFGDMAMGVEEFISFDELLERYNFSKDITAIYYEMENRFQNYVYGERLAFKNKYRKRVKKISELEEERNRFKKELSNCNKAFEDLMIKSREEIKKRDESVSFLSEEREKLQAEKIRIIKEKDSVINCLNNTLNHEVNLKNEIISNYHGLVGNILKAETTKGWKLMCFFRRIKEQILSLDIEGKKHFFKWIKTKLLRQPMSEELGLPGFSPIKLAHYNIDSLVSNNIPIPENIPEEEASTESRETEIHLDINFGYNIDFKQGDIFRFPVIDWDFRWQRPQQFCVKLSQKGYRVFYFSIDTVKLNNEDALYGDIADRVEIKSLQGNIIGVKLCSNQALNIYQDTLTDPLDITYLLWSIDYLKKKFKIAYSISILDLPFWFTLARKIDKNRIIYDCMDQHSGFSNNSSEMVALEENLSKKADLVITSSQSLYDKIREINPSNVLIRNGGEYNHFSKEPGKIASEFQDIKGPVIGYYGAISEWFDINLIKALAERNKDWTFMLIGHTFGCNISEAEKLDNVFFPGEKPYEMLPEYLYGFDVCIIPFILNELTEATNPVKIYEYFSAGKPVVSTELPELKLMGDMVKFASTPEEFEDAINNFLKALNDKKLEKERREFAAKNTWHSRFLELKDKIVASFYPKVSIIIITYNNWKFTEECLDSIFRYNDYPNTEIIIVDNASFDETREKLKEINHPDVKVLLQDDNKGFAGGNNVGLEASSGEYIILLNNDTIVTPGFIHQLAEPLKNNKEIGLVGPVSNSVGNEQIVDFFIESSAGGPDYNWLNDFYGFYKDHIRYTDRLGFFCTAMRRDVYEKVGSLDTDFGLGMFEDDDYCKRVVNKGYKIAIIEDCFVYHYGSASFKKLEDEKFKANWERNKGYFEEKWGEKWPDHNPPASLFWGINDPQEIARKLKDTGKKTVLIKRKDEDWTVDKKDWHNTAFILAKDCIVIVNVMTYHGKKVEGIRKLGPYIYLTSSLSHFEKTAFDMVL